MHLKSDDIKIRSNDKPDEVIGGSFQTFLSRYHIRLETSMKCIDFVLDSVPLLYYECHKRIQIKVGHIYILPIRYK